MYKRKALAILLTLAMVLGSFSMSAVAETGVVETNSTAFSDVNGHWAEAAIYKWSGNGIVNGYQGLFRPDDSITRGEMAVILDNMMDYQVAAQNTFTDLTAEKFYTESVLKANAAGIIKGNAGKVRPADKISREEAAVMLGRAFSVKESTSGAASFSDAAAVSSWAKGYVTAMEAKSYIKGSSNSFRPEANITRAEIVTMIDNIVKAYYTEAGTYTENVNGTAVIKVTGVTLKDVSVSENLIIAEGVGQGDVTLDSVTVKGETVVRGGGENSVHITGDSDITSIRIEKTDGKIRITVSDGNTVREIVITKGKEIIITGTVGTINVVAPDTNIILENASIGTINVESTASYTNIHAGSGAVIGTINASAQVTVSGKGTVSNVNLNQGADNSKVTTPNTKTTVAQGVTGASIGDTIGGSAGGSGGSGGGGDGGGSKLLTLAVNDVTAVNASLVTFNTAVAGAAIKWNNITLDALTVAGDNEITVPLMVSGTGNKLEVSKSGYTVFTKNNVIYTASYDADAVLGAWIKDRTEPKSWTNENGWITLTTTAQQASNSWYDWQGRGAVTNVGATEKWKVETQLDLTEELLNGTGVRTSIWIQVDGVNGDPSTQNNVLDWAILQYKNDTVTSVKGWESWDSEAGVWLPVNGISTQAGLYTFTMIYDKGTMFQYINGALVREYDIVTDEGFGDVSAPSSLILQSRTFGEEYTARWTVPTVEYVEMYSAGTKFISTAGEFSDAVAKQAAGQNWIIKEGAYEFTEQQNITQPVIIQGLGTVTLKAVNDSWSKVNGYKHLLEIKGGTEAEPVKISNVEIDANGKSHAVNTYNNAYGILDDVTIKNGLGAGLSVNGSTIIANNLNTSGNRWGAVNVDPGSGVTTPSVFKLTGFGELQEATQIWSDGANVTDTITVTVTADQYEEYSNAALPTYRFWTDRPLPLDNTASITKAGKTILYHTIQAAVTAASEGDVIKVGEGTYQGNLILDKPVTLLSVSGSASTSIIGNQSGNELGTIVILPGVDGVQIGDVNRGFTIRGIDGSPGIEKAAVYFQGANSDSKVIGNEIEANGDGGLMTEYNAAVINLIIDSNIFSGKTFNGDTPGGLGFSSQFTELNVPRQLVVISGGSTVTNTVSITFTNNIIIGIAGGINIDGREQGNTLVTIDAVGANVTGNTFDGYTTRSGASLRVRGINTVISDNSFSDRNLIHMYVRDASVADVNALIGNNNFIISPKVTSYEGYSQISQ